MTSLRGLAIAAAILVSGCASQSGLLPGESYYYEMAATMSPPLTQPLPLGQSKDITVTEERCLGSDAQGNTPPPNVGCGTSYAPGHIQVQELDSPCGVTVTSGTKPGKFVATRTAPGDPEVMANGVGGWCEIEFTDVKTGGYTNIFA